MNNRNIQNPQNSQDSTESRPPVRILDRTYDGRHVGCEDLRRAVEEKRPRLHVFGHVHEAHGIERSAATTFVNASTCDLGYRAVHAPLVMELAPQVSVPSPRGATEAAP